MRAHYSLLIWLFIATSAATVPAEQLLFNQRPHYPGGFGAWTSDVSQNGTGWRVKDNFRLLAGGEISSVGWQGIYLDYQNSNNNPTTSDTVGWNLAVYADRNGRPGAEVYSQDFAIDSVNRRSLGNTTFDSNVVPIFNYSVQLAEPFTAQADQQYWMSVQATSAAQSSFNPLWGWASGDGDDGRLYQENGGRLSLKNQDASFNFHGTRTGELPSSGVRVSEFAELDSAMHDFMQVNNIEAANVGIMRDGEFVYQRGYGWQDPGHANDLPEDALMRLASISKPITAATVRRLADDGLLSLNDRVFDLGQPQGGILKLEPHGGLGDERLQDIRVIDLLRHRGGWDRNQSPDYAFWDIEIANQMGIESPPGPENKARFVLGTSLDHRPNSTYAYSNIGFMMLGLVIEEVTGEEYIDVVHEKVFDPIGVPRSEIELGRTLVENRNPREPWYDQPASWSATNVFDPDGRSVPWPDGGWDHEGAESYGGLIASSKALLAFADNYVVAGRDIGEIRSGNEGRGWNWYHTGSLVGTNTVLRQRGDGTTFAVMFNRRAATGEEYVSEIGDLFNDFILDSSNQWPDALVFDGDGNGDGWITPADLDAFSFAISNSTEDFLARFPDGQLAAFDLSDDGEVDRFDLPMLFDAFIDNHNQEADLQRYVVGDVNGDWQIDVQDADILSEAIAKQLPIQDVDGNDELDLNDMTVFVKRIIGTSFGDSNLDGVFDSRDFVEVFRQGEYEDDVAGNSRWSEGDWDADGDFSSSDFVVAFRDGGYERPAPVRFVPEPNDIPLSFLMLGLMAARVGRTRTTSDA